MIYTEGTLWIAWSQTHNRGGEVELNDVRLVEWDVVSAGPIRETTAHGEGAIHGLSIESTLDGPVVIATTTATSQRITFDTDLVERSLVRARHAYDAVFELDHTWDTTGDVPVEGEGGARIVGAHLQNIDVYPQHCRAIAIGAHVVEACPHLARNGGSPPRVGKVGAIARSTPKNALFPGK